MNVRVASAARTRIGSICAYIHEQSPAAARRVAAALEAAIVSLEQHPKRGRPGRLPGTRELLVPGIPYLLVYRVEERSGTVIVANVYHHAQDR